MNRRIFIALILTVALWPPLAHAAQPEITRHLQSVTVREMDYISTSVQATDSAGHLLAYDWSIVSDDTDGRAGISASGSGAELSFPWISAAAAGQLNGSKVVVKVVVRHLNPNDGPETSESQATFTISGVNHPPTAVIAGRLGTETERIPTGYGICANCYDSNDQDGDTFKALWNFGAHSGGRWQTAIGNQPPTLYGSEGGQACFTVLDMSAPIDQEITVTLEDGLHKVVGKAICYLKPAGTVPPPTGSNRAPTVSFPSSTVQAQLGGTALLVAEAEDLDGDVLDYSFVFLQDGSTVASSAISVQTLSTTRKRVTATIPAALAGTYSFRFTAKERNTTDRKSASGTITLQITTGVPPGGAGPGDVTDTPGDCGAEAGSSPTVTITPNPTTTKPLFRSGDSATISVVAFDASERPSPLNPIKTQKGANVTWVLSELSALGVNNVPVTTPRASDLRYTDSTLTFPVPTVPTARDVYLTVVATDVYDCTRTVRFAIRLEPAQTSNNQPPVAKIQYKVGSAAYADAPTMPVAVETGSAVTVSLKSNCTDDGGISALTHTWSKQDNITAGGVTLGSATGATTSLSVTAHTKGTLTVTLSAKDQGNLTGTAQISFNIVDPAQKPIARATAKVGGQALSTGSVDAGTIVTLDGSASSRPDNSKNNLTYQWTQTEGPNVAITDADEATARFTAPAASDAAPRLKFKLIVSDGSTPSDPVEVTVNLSLPSLYFSQVAVGPLGTSEFRTVLLLVNRNETPANGVEVKFYGQDGNPLDVTINDVPWDDKPFNIAGLGSKRLTFTGHQDLKLGWARVKANVQIAGLVLYQIVGNDNGLESEVGLYATEASTKFATFYDPETETAIAVANPSAEPAEVRIRLMDDQTGKEVVSKLLFVKETGGVLPGMNHNAKFITLEFLGELPTSFSLGTLVIESDVPVSITVLKTRGGVVFSTLPVASMK